MKAVHWLLLIVAILLLLWLVATIALWAAGLFPATIILSGIVAGALGLIMMSQAVRD